MRMRVIVRNKPMLTKEGTRTIACMLMCVFLCILASSLTPRRSITSKSLREYCHCSAFAQAVMAALKHHAFGSTWCRSESIHVRESIPR